MKDERVCTAVIFLMALVFCFGMLFAHIVWNFCYSVSEIEFRFGPNADLRRKITLENIHRELVRLAVEVLKHEEQEKKVRVGGAELERARRDFQSLFDRVKQEGFLAEPPSYKPFYQAAEAEIEKFEADVERSKAAGYLKQASRD